MICLQIFFFSKSKTNKAAFSELHISVNISLCFGILQLKLHVLDCTKSSRLFYASDDNNSSSEMIRNKGEVVLLTPHHTEFLGMMCSPVIQYSAFMAYTYSAQFQGNISSATWRTPIRN